MPFVQRTFGKTHALDGSDEAHAASSAFWFAVHARTSLAAGSYCSTPFGGTSAGLLGNLSRAADRYRLEHRCSGLETVGLVESYCLDPFVGCACLLYMVGQLSSKEHSVAGRRILHSQRYACRGVF